MARLAQLEAWTSELAEAVKTIITHCQNLDSTRTSDPSWQSLQALVPLDAPVEAHLMRQSALVSLTQLQTLLRGPEEFLQLLASQNQLLASVQWLGEFQIPAFIPLGGSVLLKDVAELAGVPEDHLCRVVRMTATVGFLQEPQSGSIAHSALSASFVKKPSYMDAALFLAGTAAPTALHMAAATQQFGNSSLPNQSAYNVAMGTTTTFATACEQQPKLQRQWPAYQRYGMGGRSDVETHIPPCLDLLQGRTENVVEVGARSTEYVLILANLYPTLHFTVQINSANLLPPGGPSTPNTKFDTAQTNAHPRITIQQRSPGTPQNVHHAAVYILHLPSPSPELSFTPLMAWIVAELRAHLDVLRNSRAATLVLMPRLLPKHGTVDTNVEAMARLRDLSLLQLANEREMETPALINMLNTVSDTTGRLVLINQVQSRNNVGTVWEIQYQAYTDR